MNAMTQGLCKNLSETVTEIPHSIPHPDNDTHPVANNTELVQRVARHLDSQLRRHFRNNLRARHQDEVDDLMQELYSRLFVCRNPSGIESIQSFVFTIAQNLLRDRSRRVATHMRDKSCPIDAMEERISEATCPERIAEGRQVLQQILTVIGEWPSATREAFVQHRVYGDSHKIIGARLGVSVSMIEKHIAKASNELKQHLYAAEFSQ